MESKLKRTYNQTKHPNLWFYILSLICMVLMLLVIDYQFNRIVDPEWLSHVSGKTMALLALNAVADAFLLLIPFVLLPPRWRKWSWLIIILLAFWCLAQMLYMPTYRDLMPFSSFMMTENVGDTLLTSIKGAIRPRLLEVLLPPIVLYIIYRIWLKKPMEQTCQPVQQRLLLAVASLLAFALIRGGMTLYHSQDNDEPTTFSQQFVNDYCVMWTRQGDYLNLNGAVPYIIYSAYTTIFDRTTLSDEEKQQVTRFINEQPQYTDDIYASARGKNVILLVVESLNSWVIDLRINGHEVSPTLNALCHDTSSNLVSLKMKSQVKNGRSSDGIFMYNTGLLPLTVKAVTNTYGDATYPALCKAMGDYSTFYACCDEPTLWNVKNMSKTYGYGAFYGKAEINEAIKQNNYLLDKTLLEEVSQIIPTLSRPFMGLVATAGMHHPFDEVMSPSTWIQNSGMYTKEVRCYLERVNAFDTELAAFIDRLKSQGIYQNTMIVIVSDHNEMVDDNPGGRPSIDKEGDDCVMVIVNSGQAGEIEGPIGQIDIYPTLLDLLGLNFQKWKGLGYSLLRNDITSVATSPSSIAGSSTLSSRQQEAWHISDMIITSRWFNPKW